MNALIALEFDRIRRYAADFTVCEEGRQAILTMEPHTESESKEELSAEVGEILRMLQSDYAPPGGAVPDLEDLFSALRHDGSVLELEDLVAVRRLLDTAAEFHRFFRTGEENEMLSRKRSDKLRPPRDLQRSLHRLLTGDGHLNEDAIPEIAALRRRITNLHHELQRSSEAIIRANRELYRDDRSTVRDGRTVLPLVADFKGRVDGIVHESSGSGETLFVEPRELIDLNNNLAQTQNQILREIRRVMRELTEAIRGVRPELTVLRGELNTADERMARARYGRELDGRIVPSGDSIHLRNARHPLLGAACVPLDITYERETRLLVLSGPNTGGKTVLLKTLGLLTVMNQCGIPIPVAEESTLPLFKWIGVDIGDEQSIDQALSTFSAHLRTLGEITRRADRGSLVLLDELGTGTDPEEGSALSLAIIDHLMERDATILVTTHQTVLKHYGYTRPGAANAAMAFNEEEHRPTYRVIPGRPGVSHAIETALEQGIDATIVDRAREYLKDTNNSVSEIINRLVEEEDNLQRQRLELTTREQELQEERNRIIREREALETQADRLKREGLAELNRALGDARRQVEQEIRTLRERGADLAREEILAVHDPVARIEELRDRTAQELSAHDKRRRTSPITQPRPGMEVRHRTTGRTGTIRSIRKDRAEVQFGAVRMTVDMGELESAESETGDTGASAPRTTYSRETLGGPPPMELDLRGYRLDAALEELERQVDTAIMYNLSSFGVIHGTGTGVLQKGVREYLQQRKEVAGIAFARPEDGGFGKTVVELSRDSTVG